MNNLRFAIRQLFKHPTLNLVAMGTLALGIGATTTVFCWTQAVLLHPFPGVREPARLAVLCGTRSGQLIDTVSLPDLKDYRALTNVFAGIVGSQVTPACARIRGRLEWIYGQITTANFFEVLGVRPFLGRYFLPEEDRTPGGAPVVVLSHSYWQRRFGGDPAIIGRSFELNQHAFTVIGVAPPEFRGSMSGLNQDFWAPVVMHDQVAHFGSLDERGDAWLHVIARLQPGVRRAEAQAALDLACAQLAAAYPDTNREAGGRVLHPSESPWGGQAYFLPVLRILLAVSFGVLLIVTANVANLLLARALGRQKEIAIRLAVGASRRHLVRQLLTESLVLAAGGGVGGMLLAHWATGAFRLFLPRTYLPVGYDFTLDGMTLLFTVGVSAGVGLLFGLAPAWQALRTDLHGQLKEGGRSATVSAPHLRVRSTLVAAEIALALVLLSGAGLCLKGFRRAHAVDPGFNPDRLLLAGMRLGAHGYTETNGIVFYRRLQDRLKAMPGVTHAALASWFPLGFEGGSATSILPEGYQRAPNEDLGVGYAIVSPDYFATMQIPFLEGRDFTPADAEASERVAIINEAAARRFWPGQSPIGKRFRSGRHRDLTVVGVVKTGRYRTLSEPARPFLYTPFMQGVWDLNLGVVVRTQADPTAHAKALREAVRATDSAVELWTIIAYRDFMQAAYLAQRVAATLLAALGITAALLAGMGIYGVMAYAVGQRTHEIGIRMALGADTQRILRLMLGSGSRLTLVGLGLGLAGALATSRLLASLLHGVSPYDPSTLLIVSTLLAVVSLAACALPAWRAASVDPLGALRNE